MTLYLINTVNGLVPCSDQDYDDKLRLKLGEIYEVKIKVARNYEFHKKYFALMRCAWEYQNEKVVAFFKDFNRWRKYVEVAAGYSDVFFSKKLNQFVDIPRSIAFDKMDNLEFTKLYENVKDVLYQSFFRDLSREEFEKKLESF